MFKSWLIGSASDCDLIVIRPEVSGRHCLLRRGADGFTLEDLISTNGTYVNGMRVSREVPVSPSDAITLGHSTPMPWPADSRVPAVSLAPESGRLRFRGVEMTIGRDPDCEMSLDLPQVSWRHARLFQEGRIVYLEDLGSSNGTFVNGSRTRGRTLVADGDLIGLGSHALTLEVPELPIPAYGSRPAVGGRTITEATLPLPVPIVGDLDADRPAKATAPWIRALGLMGHALVVALAIGMIARLDVPRGAAGQAATAVSADSWIALAATWTGLAAAYGFLGRSTRERKSIGTELPAVQRFGLAAAASLAQSVLIWVVAAWLVGLQAPWGWSIGLVGLASGTGLALGLVITQVLTKPRDVGVAALGAISVMYLFGSEGAPLRPAGGVGLVADLMPSRWAFEGLLLLEAGGDQAEVDEPRPEVNEPRPDLAEKAFPINSSRSGVRVCVLALGLMALGYGGTAGILKAWTRGIPGTSSHSRGESER